MVLENILNSLEDQAIVEVDTITILFLWYNGRNEDSGQAIGNLLIRNNLR